MSKTEAYEDYFGEESVKNLKEAEKEADVLGVEGKREGKKKHGRGSCGSASKKDQGAPAWLVGLVFILIGGSLLASNVFGFGINNWWALFFLIPAGGCFASATHLYQSRGKIDEAVSGPLFGGFLMLLLMSMFLFNLSWNLFWPVALIMLGLKLLTHVQTA